LLIFSSIAFPRAFPDLVHAVQYQIQRTGLTIQPAGQIVKVRYFSVPKASMAETPDPQFPHKRRFRRAKIIKPVRVRPSEPRDEHFEDLPLSVNASKEGIFFTTRRKDYYKGMRVFVTFPFSSPHDPMNCEYVAEVVRIEELPKGKFGIAVHLKMTMNYSAAALPGAVTRI
jgi:PilZ domain